MSDECHGTNNAIGAAEAEFRLLARRFGWWNMLNTMAGMAYDRANYDMPIYSQAWMRLSCCLDDCARLYTKYLEKEKIPDAKPAMRRDNV